MANLKISDLDALTAALTTLLEGENPGAPGESGKFTLQELLDLFISAELATIDDVEVASVNAQTGTTYTLAIGDRGGVVTMNNGSANTLTIPLNSAVAFDVGSVINVVQLGAGATTIEGATGVTLNGVSGGSGAINNRYQGVSLLKIATDTWVASGDIAAVA
jgi:hypothetical protein